MTGDMNKHKKCQFLIFSFFAILCSDTVIFLQKRKNWKTRIFIHFVVSPKVIELQRCTMPHFEALDLLIWHLAWLLTLGLILFAVWSKTFVNFFSSPSICTHHSKLIATSLCMHIQTYVICHWSWNPSTIQSLQVFGTRYDMVVSTS